MDLAWVMASGNIGHSLSTSRQGAKRSVIEEDIEKIQLLTENIIIGS